MSRENVLSQLKTLETELHDQLNQARFEAVMLMLTNVSNEEACKCAEMRFDEIRNIFNKRVSLIMDEYVREEKELETLLDKNMEVLADVNETEEIRAMSKGNLDRLNIRMEMADKEKETLDTFNSNINTIIDEMKEITISALNS